MKRALLATAAGYALGTILLAIYGTRVCAIMAGMGLGKLAAVLAMGFLVAFQVNVTEWRKRPHLDPARRWTSQWLTWLIPAAGLCVIELVNAVKLGRALESSFKMMVGAAALGFFVSCLVSLDLENGWLRDKAAGKEDVAGGAFLSIASRILGFSRWACALMGGVIFLMAVPGHQRVWDPLLHPRADSVPLGILVSVIVLLAALQAVTSLYRRNFALLYDLEYLVLESVREGRYDVRVPLVSRDEFRKIAEGTNEMIAGLRERERIRATFGKYVSKEIADAILERGDAKLGGELKQVAVLFTDLRNYTTLSEHLAPELVVSVLNEYFTMVVRAVSRNHGMVDKFIGDAAMAVFGISGREGACPNALQAALEILQEMGGLNERLKARGLPVLENGIGIHHGPVIAGNIGAEERLEYTVIGDTVNVASRLESLTKGLESPLAVSVEVYELAGGLKERLNDLGAYMLKGKTTEVHVFGLSGRKAKQA